MIREGPGRRVGEDDGGLAGVQDLAHDGGGHVGEIHQHSQAIHLPHHLPAEGREAAVPRLVGGGVGPVDGGPVGEGQVPGPQVVEGPERPKGVLHGVPPSIPRMEAILPGRRSAPRPTRQGQLQVIRVRAIICRAMSICSSWTRAAPSSTARGGT
jgi:hypothetical protein